MSSNWHIARLNFAFDQWDLYAQGYKNAGDLLFEYIEESQANQDILVYPLFFLYRQYIELRLKGLIMNGNEYLDINENFPMSHELTKLWKSCRKILDEVWPGEDLEDLEKNIINYFSKIDPTSLGFRYPTDKKDNPSLPGIQNIDLVELKDRMEKISTLLDGADFGISTYLDIKRDKQADNYWE